MDAQHRSALILIWQEQSAVVDERRREVGLGALTSSGLRVTGAFTSRHHATIERRKHHYVLVDHSTNGTFVQTEDERVSFVRRGEVRLWGEGWISLGGPLAPASAIRFRHE